LWEPGDQFGQPLLTGEVHAATGEVDESETLPVDGLYTVVVEPDEAATGGPDIRVGMT